MERYFLLDVLYVYRFRIGRHAENIKMKAISVAIIF